MYVLGIGVSAINVQIALDTIDTWIRERDPNYVCVTGVHGVMESQEDKGLLQIHNNAGLVTPDGMPLVWIARARGHRKVERVYGPDLLLAVCGRSSPRKHKHFFYGGAAGVPELLTESLQKRFPGLQIVGTYSPPYRPLLPQEDAAIVEQIDRSGADIVWVGLSTPKQERWMAAHVGRVRAPVLIGVGAAFDFHAGLKSQAPGWMQRNGLEWLYRLVQEPRRLGPRYLINNPRFVALLLAEQFGIRRGTAGRSPDEQDGDVV